MIFSVKNLKYDAYLASHSCCNNISIANCSAGQNGELEDEEIHNALLISKAPEMLEMLIICQQLTDCRTLFKDINKLIKEATEL